MFENAAIVNDQAVVLAFIDAVGAGDGLHQGVRLERLVEVERGQARNVKAGQPHGADNGYAEGVLLLLERLVNCHALHIAEPRLLPHGFR